MSTEQHQRRPRPPAALAGPEIRLALTPAGAAAALAWLAGAAASGGSFPRGREIVGLALGGLLIGTVWFRLVQHGLAPSAASSRAPQRRLPAISIPCLPYTQPDSLSASCTRTLRNAFLQLQATLRRGTAPERGFLLAVWLLACALLGHRPLVACAAGLALLGLLRLARPHRGARPFLAGIALVAWPWWLGHSWRAPLSLPSLGLGLLWGIAAGAWLALLNRDTPQKAVLGFLLPQAAGVLLILFSRPFWGAFLAFALLGQSLPLARPSPNASPAPSSRIVSLWAAVSLLSSGLALGGWLH